MKLAIIRQHYNPYGGAEIFVERVLHALAGTDLDVSLITRRWTGKGPAAHRQVVCDPFYLGRTWRDAGFAQAACAAVNGGAYDLVQSHVKLPCCDIYRAGDGVHAAWLQRRARGMGAVGHAWLYGQAFHRYTLAAERALFASPRLRRIVCISELVQREVAEWSGLPLDKLPVIYNGIDLQAFNPAVKASRDTVRRELNLPLDAPLFLFVGSGYARKGVARVLDALPREAWLLVVGKDRHLARYEARAQQLGIADRVCFLGPRANVKDYYGAADAFVFPTLYEPFGNVVLEAMACGLPVITSFDCGGAELIEDGINGFVRAGEDGEALRDAMNALTDLTRAAAMGAAAARTAQAFDMAAMTQKMIGLYQDLNAGR